MNRKVKKLIGRKAFMQSKYTNKHVKKLLM